MLEFIWMIIFYILASVIAFVAYEEASDFFLKGMYYVSSAGAILFGFHLTNNTVLDRVYAYFDAWVSSPGTDVHVLTVNILTLFVFACFVAPAIIAGITASKLIDYFAEKNCENR